MQAIWERTAGKTVVMITHRMIGIHRMDKSILIDSGRVLAQGRHTALLSEIPRYRQFWGVTSID
jgi:ATP-binding cassette subfamily C protein CydC